MIRLNADIITYEMVGNSFDFIIFHNDYTDFIVLCPEPMVFWVNQVVPVNLNNKP